jgi:hypothetical protein
MSNRPCTYGTDGKDSSVSRASDSCTYPPDRWKDSSVKSIRPWLAHTRRMEGLYCRENQALLAQQLDCSVLRCCCSPRCWVYIYVEARLILINISGLTEEAPYTHGSSNLVHNKVPPLILKQNHSWYNSTRSFVPETKDLGVGSSGNSSPVLGSGL